MTMLDATVPTAALPRARTHPLLWLLLALSVVAAIGNAWLYTREVAIPVISADSWYFLDAFVAKDMDGTLQWRDFFLKRDSSDHSQPLHRLQLLLNTHWFGLDFTVEALIGIVGLMVCVLMLLTWAIRNRRTRQLRLGDACVLALLPLLMASINSREIYFWSLVTLFYIVLPFALLSFFAASRQRPLPLFGLMLLCLLALDGAGVLACLALVATLLLDGLRGAPWRSTLRCIGAVLLALLLYKVAYAWLMPPVPSAQPLSLGGLWHSLRDPATQPWRWAILPASASIAHLDHLTELFGDRAIRVQIIVGISVLLLHALFWWSALRGPRSRLSFVAVALMLFVYGMTAGIILSRVPVFGTDYLLQHRYVTFYQLANVALLLQWLAARDRTASVDPSSTVMRRWPGLVLPVLALLMVASWQLHLASTAWVQSVYVKQYGKDMAQAVFCLGAHPQISGPPVCVANHQVCGWDADVRNWLVKVLHDNQLNVYSPAFQRRYDMAPDPARREMCVPTATAPAASGD